MGFCEGKLGAMREYRLSMKWMARFAASTSS